MADIKTLKTALVDHLVQQIETPGEGGVPGNVLSTAAKIVKDFAHEIDDNEGELAMKDKKLAAFLNRKGIDAVN